MRSYILLIVVVLAIAVGELCQASRSTSLEWGAYKKKFGKIYETPEEDARRFALFLKARERIERHNALDRINRKGLTRFSDLTPDEWVPQAGPQGEFNLEIKNSPRAEAFLRSILDDQAPVPEEFDWRKFPGRITPVKDQQECQAGWAFATLGALEGQQLARNLTRELISLSAQQLVDCSLMDYGCDRGYLYWAFNDVAGEGGIEAEATYPYTGDWAPTCALNKSNVVMTDAGSAYLPYHDEKTLMKAVARFGPVPTQVFVTEHWGEYKSGLLIDDDCDDREVQNHAILLVGYGSDPVLGDYWIAKNSYGDKWGEEGYLKIQRGVEKCGVGFYSNIPVFNS